MEQTKEKTVLMFDASIQKDVEHKVDIDGNGEIVLTSIETGRFVKLPAGTTAEGVKAYVEAHKASNEGQKSTAAIAEEKAKLLADL